MKTIKLKITVLLLLFLINISCSKDDDATNPIVATTFLKKEILSIGTFTWNYDTQNRLASVVFITTNPLSAPSNTHTITNFDSSGRISKATIDYVDPMFDDLLVENTYDSNGKLTLVEYKYVTTLAQEGKVVIEYLPNQIKFSDYGSTNNLRSVELNTLSTDNKNVIERKRYNALNVLLSVNVYSNFDTNRTPVSLFPLGYTPTPYRENNHRTDTFTLISTGAVTTNNLTFEYNTDGFATKRTSSSGLISNYEYIKI